TPRCTRGSRVEVEPGGSSRPTTASDDARHAVKRVQVEATAKTLRYRVHSDPQVFFDRERSPCGSESPIIGLRPDPKKTPAERVPRALISFCHPRVPTDA